MTTNKLPAASRIGDMPSDLSRLLGEKGLLKLVLNAVQTVDPAQFAKETPQPPGYRPQMLLTLLTYCYLAKIYGSRDIEWAARYDKTVRYICAHNFPDWQTLRRFRRQHRPLVEQTLAYVLKNALQFQLNRGEGEYAGEGSFESDLHGEIGRTIRNRLDVAALMDGVESD